MLNAIFWNGRCPQCKSGRMRLNRDDFFECEQCNLQIVLTAPGLMATILKFRGVGEYRTKADYADAAERNEFLCPQTRDYMPFTSDELFNNREYLNDYLQNQVEPTKIIKT